MPDARITRLLRWYIHHARDLPWRHTHDAYNILVSEVMLQQTQVSRVLHFYPRWIKQFPNWKALARAKTATLLHTWAGLGYNRRALQLREAARRIIATQRTPQTIKEWQELPGVGPYTAAAVYAFSAHKRAIAIDTNVRRVAGRLFLGLPHPILSHDQRIAQRLEQTVPHHNNAWMLPQAFMDLGASHCTVQQPDCARCPLRSVCAAAPKFLSGRAPEKKHTTSRERIHEGKKYPDRIYRGRLLAHIRAHGSARATALGAIIDDTFDVIRDHEWLQQMIQRMKKDGLIQEKNSLVSLPRS